jgi:hypothetical protein
MASAAFSIGDSASLLIYEADASDTVSLALDSVDGVLVSSVSVVATDETTEIADWPIASATATSTTIQTPAQEGCAAIIEWRINNGTTYDTRTGQATVGDLVKRAKICVPTSDGRIVLVPGETTETDPTYGWAGPVNDLLRDIGGVAGFNAQATTVNIATTSTGGTLNAATRAGAATNLGNSTGALTVAASTATVTGATSVAVASPTTSINATGSAGTTNIGTRAGEQVNVGTGAGSTVVIGESNGAGTTIQGISALDGDGNDVSLDASTLNITAPSVFAVADTFAVDAQSGGATISSAATPATAVADVVKLKGDVGVSIRAGTTDPATPASGEVRIHGESLVTIDGIRADYERVAKGNGTTLEAGKVNDLTGTTWTLPALSGVAEGESVYVVHSLASGTISRAGSDVIDAGNGHTTDTTFTLSDQQSEVRFRKVSSASAWRVSFTRSANAGAGSGSSISQAGGSVAVDASGNVEGTAAADQSVSFSATNTGATQSATLSLDGTNGDASLTCTSGVEIGCGVSGNANVRVGNSAYMRCSISGANLRTSWVDAGGANALTIDADNAASSITAVGTMAVTCATSLTETVGSATRTVTASGANRTETYGGTLAIASTAFAIGGLTLAGSAAGGLMTGGRLVSFTSLLDFSDHVRMVFTGDGTEPCILAPLAGAAYVQGAEVEVFIPAGEAGSLNAPAFVDDADSNLPALDPARDYYFWAKCSNGRFPAGGLVLALDDNDPPGLVDAEIDSSDPDRLILTFDEPVILGGLTGLSITGTGAPTITAIVSGQGTTTVVLDLSADAVDGDAWSFVVGAGRLVQDLHGNLVATGTTAITLTGFGGPAFAWGDEIALWSADDWTTSGSDVLGMADQIGSSDMVASATRPQVDTMGSLAAACVAIVAGSYLSVDVPTTAMASGAIGFIVDFAAADTTSAYLTLIAGGLDGSDTSVNEILVWNNPADVLQLSLDATSSTVNGTTPSGAASIVATWDGTLRRIYVNGTLSATVTGGSTNGNITKWTIGVRTQHDGGWEATGVKIREVRISPALKDVTDADDYDTFRLAVVGT